MLNHSPLVFGLGFMNLHVFLSVSFFAFSSLKVPDVSSISRLFLLIQASLPLIPIANIPLFCPHHSVQSSLPNQTNAQPERSHFNACLANWYKHPRHPATGMKGHLSEEPVLLQELLRRKGGSGVGED